MTDARERKCDKCGGLFTHKRLDTRFCEKHRNFVRHKKPELPERKCRGCETMFIPKSDKNIWCSKPCRSGFYAEQAKRTPLQLEEQKELTKIRSMYLYRPKETDSSLESRDYIEEQTAKFLKEGGKITQCPTKGDFNLSDSDYDYNALTIDDIADVL